MKTIHVYTLPELISEEKLVGGVAVVVDILRATTTMLYALDSGAKCVIPRLTIEDAFQIREKLRTEGIPEAQILLGGERQGILIEGFDIGNSPEDYTPENVSEKTLVFTTTNGTRALFRSLAAEKIFIAAFVNLTAMTKELLKHDQIHIICAGTDNQFTEEDVLFAGALVDRLMLFSDEQYELDTQATVVREIWLKNFTPEKRIGEVSIPAESLAQKLRQSRGGKNLLGLNLGKDILAASHIDKFDFLASFDELSEKLYRV